MEFVGLFIGGVLFFALSVVVGCLYGGVAWLILGSRKDHRKFLWTAARLPPVFAAYMVACAVVFGVFIRARAIGSSLATSTNGCRMATLSRPWRKCRITAALMTIRRALYV